MVFCFLVEENNIKNCILIKVIKKLWMNEIVSKLFPVNILKSLEVNWIKCLGISIFEC